MLDAKSETLDHDQPIVAPKTAGTGSTEHDSLPTEKSIEAGSAEEQAGNTSRLEEHRAAAEVGDVEEYSEWKVHPRTTPRKDAALQVGYCFHVNTFTYRDF